MTIPAIGSWADVEQLLEQRPSGSILKVPRGWLEHPRAHGMRRTFSLPDGQVGDYWKRLDEGKGLHVIAIGGYYLARLEAVEAAQSGEPASAHAREVAVGALLGVALGQTAGAVLVAGAVSGLLAALFRERFGGEAGAPSRASSLDEAVAPAPVSRR